MSSWVLIPRILLISLVSFTAINSLDLSTLRDLQLAAKKEQRILSQVEEYVQVLEGTIEAIRGFIERFDNTTVINWDERKNLPGNSLIAWGLLQKLLSFQEVEHLIWKQHNATNTLLHFLDNDIRTKMQLPNRTDLTLSQEIICQLISMYELDLDDLELGTISGIETQSGLDMDHFFEIGKQALGSAYYGLAVNLLEKANVMGNWSREEIVQKYSEAVEKHDQNFDPNSFFFHFAKIAESKDKDYRTRKSSIRPGSSTLHTSEEGAFLEFAGICKEKKIPKQSETQQKCILSSEAHPYWKLNPMKVEIHSEDPPIVQFHQVLTQNQIRRMQKHIQILLARSAVLSEKRAGHENTRISSSAAPHLDFPDTTLWNKKVELHTGMKAILEEEGEVLQITNYATGGFFVPHYDSFLSGYHGIPYQKLIQYIPNGDRISTFMFYLNTVEAGGRTGFPLLDLNVDPVEGSALYWFNLHRNGSFDPRLVHSGCPVLLGTKWVSTKWMYSNSQMFTHKCLPQQPY